MNRFAALLVPAVLAGALATGAVAVQPPRVAIPGNVPSWAVPSARLGDAPDGERAEVQVLLPWRPGARELAEAVSDPASPSYGRFLSAAEFRARFSPPASLVAGVQRRLESAGLELGAVPPNRMVVPARGTVAQLERAFGISLGRYRGPEGTVLRAPDAPPLVPPGAIGVRGLDEGHLLLRPGAYDEEPPPPTPDEPPTPADTTPPNAVVYGGRCSAYHGEYVDKKMPLLSGRRMPAVTCATTPQQLRAAYGLTPYIAKGIDGDGERVVIVGSHAIKPLKNDVATWSKRRGIEVPKADQIRQISYPGAYQTPSDPNETILRPKVWAVQASTLVETIHTIAPGAEVLYVGTTSSLDLATGTLQAVDLEYGDIVMNGWYSAGENQSDANIQLITQIAEQAASTGISLLFASGDLGDNTYHGAAEPTPVYPAHNAMVTAVGATSLLIGKGGKYAGELGWAKTQSLLEDGAWVDDLDSTFRGSGGGLSSKFAQPTYQRGVVPASMSSGRAVPDVAVMGDAETAMLIGYTQRFPDGKDRYSERRVASGTASTALFAGLLAVANQNLKRNLGFVNPALYALRKARPHAYRDIVRSGKHGGGVRYSVYGGGPANDTGDDTYVLKRFEQFQSNAPAKGYDTSSGIGSPSTSFLALLR